MTIDNAQIVLARPVAIPLGTYEQYKDFAHEVSQSKMLGGMSAADALLVLARGREIGLAPAAALTSVHVIKGKPTLSARAKYASCLARKELCTYFVEVECTDDSCTYETFRVGDPRPQRETFTTADAQRAGLSSNDNYKRFPKAMLRARCMAALADRVYPDVILGLATTEEMEAEVERERPVSVVALATALTLPAPPAFDTAPWLARMAACESDDALEAVGAELAAQKLEGTARDELLNAYDAAMNRVLALPEDAWREHLAAKTVTYEIANSLFKRAQAFELAGVLDARTTLAEERLAALGVENPGAFLNERYARRAA